MTQLIGRIIDKNRYKVIGVQQNKMRIKQLISPESQLIPHLNIKWAPSSNSFLKSMTLTLRSMNDQARIRTDPSFTTSV